MASSVDSSGSMAASWDRGMAIFLDARPEEQAMSWYYYLEGKISFPFQARCVTTKAVSPLRKGETVEILPTLPTDLHEHVVLAGVLCRHLQWPRYRSGL